MSIILLSQICSFFTSWWLGFRRAKLSRLKYVLGENEAVKLLIMFVANRNAKASKIIEDLHLNEHKDEIDRGA